jgi:hypothetical protein
MNELQTDRGAIRETAKPASFIGEALRSATITLWWRPAKSSNAIAVAQISSAYPDCHAAAMTSQHTRHITLRSDISRGVSPLVNAIALSRSLPSARRARYIDVSAIELTALQFSSHMVWPWSRC